MIGVEGFWVFMFCEFFIFWSNSCNRVKSVLIGSVPVFLCSQSRAWEWMVSILRCVMSCELLSRLAARKSWLVLLLGVGCGSASSWAYIRPCTAQRGLFCLFGVFASLCFCNCGLPGTLWRSHVHLRAHWKIFKFISNSVWCKMWLFICATGKCCSEIAILCSYGL